MKTRVPKTCDQARYEPVLTLPPLPPEQYAALRDNIALNGVLVPILVDDGGQRRRIIDGNHRKRIATDLGYDCPEVVQAGVGEDGRARPARKAPRAVLRPAAERRARVAATTLWHGDCRTELKKVATSSVDAVITDPIYPGIDRAYGRISEADWLALMRAVVGECRRVLKPSGSAVFLLQPNYEAVGRMRLWLWDFLLWAARDWNLVQDVY